MKKNGVKYDIVEIAKELGIDTKLIPSIASTVLSQ